MAELVNIFFNLPVFALVMCRSAGIMLAAPVFSSTSIPVRLKAALTVLLGLVMYPFASKYAAQMPSGALGYVPLMLSETGLGLIIGFAGGLVIAALRTAGALASQQMGVALASVVSPDEDSSTQAVGAFLGILGLMLFLAADGHHWFIQALAISYRDVPVGEAGWSPKVAAVVRDGFSGFLLCALRLAAPVMGIMFLVTVLIALVAKAVPQMNILLVGYPVKVFIGIVALALTFPLTGPVMRDAFRALEYQLIQLARGF